MTKVAYSPDHMAQVHTSHCTSAKERVLSKKVFLLYMCAHPTTKAVVCTHIKEQPPSNRQLFALVQIVLLKLFRHGRGVLMLMNQVLIRYKTFQNLNAGEMEGGCVHRIQEHTSSKGKLFLLLNLFWHGRGVLVLTNQI